MTAVPVNEQKRTTYLRPEITEMRLVIEDVFSMVTRFPAEPGSPCTSSGVLSGETFGLDDF